MKSRKVKIYLAGPLFTQAERSWNASLAEALRQHDFHVILPQERAEKMFAEKKDFNPKVLFDHAIQSLADCDVILAIYDGPDPDSGTSWECGYAFALGKKILGVRTDIRRGGDGPKNVNLMLSISAEYVIDGLSFSDDVKGMAGRIAQYLESISL